MPPAPAVPALPALPARRKLAGRLLSGAAAALLAGRTTLAQAASAKDTDVGLLNEALAAELEAVALYQLGADADLLSRPVLALAGQFRGHHERHAELLSGVVRLLGGRAAPAKPQYIFPQDELKTQTEFIAFAAKTEGSILNGYIAAVPRFGDRELSRAAAGILGDEAMHLAVLRYALGEDPVPDAFVP